MNLLMSPNSGRPLPPDVQVLDELRPYLKSDGGDCKISEIEGSVVKLELIGACSSCSASSVTMKMGIETPTCKIFRPSFLSPQAPSQLPLLLAPRKTLKERIPEVSEVVAIEQEQEPLTESGIEEAGRAGSGCLVSLVMS